MHARTISAGLVGLALLLGGCGAGDTADTALPAVAATATSAAPEPAPTPTPTPTPTATKKPSPSPTKTTKKPAPTKTTKKPAAPRLDQQYSSCTKAKAAGLGPYYEGEDPEYDWYDDRDNDGIVCE